MVLRSAQDDVIRVTSIKDEATEQMEIIKLQLERLKREHANLEVKTTKLHEEKEKVRICCIFCMKLSDY